MPSVDMTATVKGCSPVVMSSSQGPSSSGCPSEEAAPVRHDGGSRCYPWVGGPLTGVRRVPASC
jgi:hypothetical protein